MCLKFDFEDGVRETTDVGIGELVGGVIDSDVGATPVFACAGVTVKGVFADQGEFCVE